jgi:hypothetical protein
MPKKRIFVNPLLEDTVRCRAHNELREAWEKAPNKVRDEWYEFGKRNRLSYKEQLGGMDEKFYKRIARLLKKHKLFDYRKRVNEMLKEAGKQDEAEKEGFLKTELFMKLCQTEIKPKEELD